MSEHVYWQLQRVSRQRPDAGEVASIHNVLTALGATVEEIVATLRREDCRGPRYNDCFCPVAQYIAKKTSRAASATPSVCVVGEFTYDTGGRIDTFIGKEWARTTPPVAEVITAIDQGLYSDLNQPDRELYGPTEIN